ncbi:phage fiber-tail adaptor protein [Spiribacter halobius]|uniref:Uncharacterized protein n=1 Tax=Sediminicurvatus halobius TaxID=2182432 RepID=A0A2U2MY95_9GAMM|nr:hypothetical protein [Spiribacter halobius]PWG61762.1 hypothetical protein DEM34_14955 [Spiribacter halobius]UEX76805.1 hypothetical protein LMH63_12655 [Spiribacter halobius]
MIKHDGRQPPLDPQWWDPDETDWVGISWSDWLTGARSMVSSAWLLPDGFEPLEEQQDVTVETVDGDLVEHVNRARISGTPAPGVTELTFTNRVVFSDGPEKDRSLRVKVSHT